MTFKYILICKTLFFLTFSVSCIFLQVVPSSYRYWNLLSLFNTNSLLPLKRALWNSLDITKHIMPVDLSYVIEHQAVKAHIEKWSKSGLLYLPGFASDRSELRNMMILVYKWNYIFKKYLDIFMRFRMGEQQTMFRWKNFNFT